MLYRRVIRPTLFRLDRDPEDAHDRVLGMLAFISRHPPLTRGLALAMRAGGEHGPRDVFGLRFPNPIGLAAGLDKNGVAIPALSALGFGFVEIGAVTAHAQPGNPRPRMFRLPSEEALINRMGFNNRGAEWVAAHLARAARVAIPVGINLGKSKITPLEEATDDYLRSLDLLYPYGDYFALNVSSPNTPGLRALQERDRLDALARALVERLRLRGEGEGRPIPKPLLVKVAPDLDHAALDDLVGVCLAAGVSGLIAVNTTVSREGLSASVPAQLREETGGLSGRPLHSRALEVVRDLHKLAGDRLPIIGCGGIFTVDDARRMLDVGASLAQVYTSFIYEGPGLPRRLAVGLDRERTSPPSSLPPW